MNTPFQKNFLYLARRYLFTKHHESSIKFMIKLCCISICIATYALSLVVSIMEGFENATYQKMQGIYPDLIINTYSNPFDLQQLELFQGLQSSQIAHYTPIKQTSAFLCSLHDLNKPATIIVRGINPEEYDKVSNISKKIIVPKNDPITHIVEKNTIMIGSELAQNLQLNVNDQAILMYCTEQNLDTCMEFDHIIVTIGGIFKTGIQDVDATLIWSDMQLIDSLYENLEPDQIHIKVNDIKQDQLCIVNIMESLHCDIYSWKDLYPTLLSALKLEKYAMGFILFLIVMVASMNIVALITMFIAQKRKDIAILQCYHMQTSDIVKIFICISTLIAIFASMTGLTLAWITGILLQKYPCIKLPDNIYDSEFLPIKLEIFNFIVIFIATNSIAIITSIIATKNIKTIKIVEILKS
ncbi:ABC transporter permease [Candidatus Babeliales bacterium]|nr:ABC transporter permease [Candidatus Babeliales bacterium]